MREGQQQSEIECSELRKSNILINLRSMAGLCRMCSRHRKMAVSLADETKKESLTQ